MREDVAAAAFFDELEKLGAKPASMKILYVGPEFGSGHISQAKNLEAAAKKRGIETEMIDFHRTFGKPGSRQGYEQAVKRNLDKPGLVRAGKLLGQHLRHHLTGIDQEKLQRFADANQDSAIVVTNPHLQMAMPGVKQPVHVLHTDPEAWTGEVAWSPRQAGKRIHLGTRDAMGQLMGPDEKKTLKGLPVHPDVLKRSKKTGLMDRKSFNVTVSGGGMGLDVVGMTRGVLKSLPENATVHAVAGKNEKVRGQLERLAEKDPRVRPMGFAPLRQMMREADLNVLRAHGTTFQESVAAGKPAVYYAPDPSLADVQGQLTRSTAEFGRRNIGQPAAIGLDKLPKAVTQAVTGRARLQRLAEKHQKRMGNPADEAVRFIMRPRKEYAKTAQVLPPQEQPGRVTRFLEKAGPGLGGAAGLGIGALLGARRGKLLRGALAGLGTGATVGWVPGMVRGVREGVGELR